MSPSSGPVRRRSGRPPVADLGFSFRQRFQDCTPCLRISTRCGLDTSRQPSDVGTGRKLRLHDSSELKSAAPRAVPATWVFDTHFLNPRGEIWRHTLVPNGMPPESLQLFKRSCSYCTSTTASSGLTAGGAQAPKRLGSQRRRPSFP